MSIEWEKEWDRIYKEQGEVQSEILPIVRIAVNIFKKFGCKRLWIWDVVQAGIRYTWQSRDLRYMQLIYLKQAWKSQDQRPENLT